MRNVLYRKSESRPVDLSVLLGKAFLGIVLLSLIGWLLLSLSYCIPVSLMMPHLQSSAEALIGEGDYPLSYVGDWKFDNYTVALMLNEAAQSGNPFESALEVPRYYIDSVGQGTLLQSTLNGNEANADYAYYWHGYLILLKPLLVFFDIKEIRLIAQVAFLVLLIISSLSIARLSSGGGDGCSLADWVVFDRGCGCSCNFADLLLLRFGSSWSYCGL